jgi:peptidoglycan/xylan/chitin deacetylase (PgdA/CDA1 family)
MKPVLVFFGCLFSTISAAPARSFSHLALQRRNGTGPAAGTIITQCAVPNTIALTFDDGPYQYEASLLTTLKAADAKATFFVTGTLYNCIYTQSKVLKQAFAEGHQIGSHTWDHKNLDTQSAASVTSEMTKLEAAFANILGIKPTYMRPPSWATSSTMVGALKNLGYRIVTWDIDSNHWNKYTPAQSEAKFTGAGAGNHIVLMHEPIQTTSTTLAPWAINWAKGKGLKMVTVAGCLGDVVGFSLFCPVTTVTCPASQACWR